MRYFVALDIGGTDIKYGIINEIGKVVSQSSCPTSAREGIHNLVSQIKGIIRALQNDGYSVSGIGVSTAGVVNPQTGEIIYAGPTIPGYKGTNLKKELESTFQISTIVENDVNAAALGEAWMGAGRSTDTFFCLTLGTGIGGAFVIDRELYRGKNFRGGEIGYMGKQSKKDKSYEEKAATSALIQDIKQQFNFDNIDGETIFQKARDGDKQYEKMVKEWIMEIAKGMANIISILDPGVIIVGGGVSRQGNYLIDRIQEAMRLYLPETFVDSTLLKTAECGNNAGILGAVYPFVK